MHLYFSKYHLYEHVCSHREHDLITLIEEIVPVGINMCQQNYIIYDYHKNGSNNNSHINHITLIAVALYNLSTLITFILNKVVSIFIIIIASVLHTVLYLLTFIFIFHNLLMNKVNAYILVYINTLAIINITKYHPVLCVKYFNFVFITYYVSNLNIPHNTCIYNIVSVYNSPISVNPVTLQWCAMNREVTSLTCISLCRLIEALIIESLKGKVSSKMYFKPMTIHYSMIRTVFYREIYYYINKTVLLIKWPNCSYLLDYYFSFMNNFVFIIIRIYTFILYRKLSYCNIIPYSIYMYNTVSVIFSYNYIAPTNIDASDSLYYVVGICTHQPGVYYTFSEVVYNGLINLDVFEYTSLYPFTSNCNTMSMTMYCDTCTFMLSTIYCLELHHFNNDFIQLLYYMFISTNILYMCIKKNYKFLKSNFYPP